MNWEHVLAASGPALQVALVLVGWWFVEQQRRAKLRADRWSQLERDVLDSIDEIVAVTFEYYTTQEASVRLAARWRLRARMERLRQLCEQAHDEGAPELSDHLVSFRSTVEQGFDSKSAPKWDEESKQPVNVAHLAKVLKSELLKGRPDDVRERS